MPAELAAAFDMLMFGSTFYNTAPKLIFHYVSPQVYGYTIAMINHIQEHSESNPLTIV